MEQPEGFKAKGQETKVWRLRRALYGLKQAALVWWREMTESMKSIGFKRVVSDAGIFVYHHTDGTIVIALMYMDDGAFCGPNRDLCNKKKAEFMKKWECHDLGDLTEFLGIKIHREGQKIKIDQSAYLKKVIKRFGMIDAKHAETPMPTGWIPMPNDVPSDPKIRLLFQQIVGSIMYLMIGTHGDIAFYTIKLAQQAANPSQEHLDKALYLLRYLLATQDYAIVFDGSGNQGLTTHTDSDWASDPIKRRSQTGFFMTLASGMVCWASRAQKTVALSSTEAEYMALSDCCRQIMWIVNLFSELGWKMTQVPIFADNTGSIFIGSNPVAERRTKHIDIRYHYVRERVEDKSVEIFFVDGSKNPADMFTKNLPKPLFVQFRKHLGLEFYLPQSA